ncbi:MAG: hypothetical protein IPN09_08840 [Bacteroidetes bacterium]|nr:hypothetical protein [Bacteroidota bacterium]
MKKIISLESHVLLDNEKSSEFSEQVVIKLIALFEDNTIWEKTISNGVYSKWRRIDNYVPKTGRGELEDNNVLYKKYLEYNKTNDEIFLDL